MLSTYPKGWYFQDQVGRSTLLSGWWMAVKRREGWRTSPWKSPVPPKCRAVLELRLPGASHYQHSHHAPASPAVPLPQTQPCCLPAVLGTSTLGSMLVLPFRETQGVCPGWGKCATGGWLWEFKVLPYFLFALSALGLVIKMCTPSFSLHFTTVFLWLWPLTLCNCKPK